MKPAVVFAALALLVLLALPVNASCVFNARIENQVLRWDPIFVANRYRITEVIEGKAARIYVVREPFFEIPHRATAPFKVEYLLSADLDSGVRAAANEVFDSCSTSIETTLKVDAQFRALTRKAILPVVASTPGVNNGRFRTSLTLRGTNLRGRIVFHPAGRPASDSDPSIPYKLDQLAQVKYDDIVGAIGGSGVGSIDIIPDEDSASRVPDVHAYLYNETPNGTFGTFADAVFPYDYLHVTSHSVTIPDARFRVNVGFRALTDVTIRAAVFGVEGRLLSFYDANFPAGWMQMTAAADFARTPLQPGETLTLLIVNGSAIPFHTVTENATNDPTLVVAPPVGAARDGNVGEYVD